MTHVNLNNHPCMVAGDGCHCNGSYELVGTSRMVECNVCGDTRPSYEEINCSVFDYAVEIKNTIREMLGPNKTLADDKGRYSTILSIPKRAVLVDVLSPKRRRELTNIREGVVVDVFMCAVDYDKLHGADLINFYTHFVRRFNVQR